MLLLSVNWAVAQRGSYPALMCIRYKVQFEEHGCKWMICFTWTQAEFLTFGCLHTKSISITTWFVTLGIILNQSIWKQSLQRSNNHVFILISKAASHNNLLTLFFNLPCICWISCWSKCFILSLLSKTFVSMWSQFTKFNIWPSLLFLWTLANRCLSV